MILAFSSPRKSKTTPPLAAGAQRSGILGRFSRIELAALAIMLVIAAAVAICGCRGAKADGRSLASAFFAALRGSNSLTYVK